MPAREPYGQVVDGDANRAEVVVHLRYDRDHLFRYVGTYVLCNRVSQEAIGLYGNGKGLSNS